MLSYAFVWIFRCAASAVFDDAAELWCHQDASLIVEAPTTEPKVGLKVSIEKLPTKGHCVFSAVGFFVLGGLNFTTSRLEFWCPYLLSLPAMRVVFGGVAFIFVSKKRFSLNL